MQKICDFFKTNQVKIYIYSFLLFTCCYILRDNTVLSYEYRYFFAIGKYFALVMILLKIFLCDLKQYTRKTWIKLFFLFLILVFILYKTKDRYLLQLFILICGAKGVSFFSLTKKTLVAQTILIGSIIMLAMLGVLDNYIQSRPDQTLRYALGFKFAPSSSGYVWILTLLYIFVKKGKLHFKDYFGLFFLQVVFYFLTDARNGFFGSLLLLGFTFLYQIFFRHNKFVNRVISFGAKFLFPFLLVLSILCTIGFRNGIKEIQNLDRILSKRLYFQSNILKQYDVNLFGNSILWITDDDVAKKLALPGDINYVDNSYMNILVHYGIVFTVILCLLFYFVAKENAKKKDDFSNLLIMFVFLHAFIDPHLLKISMNIFLLLFADILIQFKMNLQKTEEEYLSLEEIHEEQLNMFRKIKNFLEKKKLTYFICGGTLLGAIRHQGFIPWDDDIDILMPREDYDKLQSILKKEKISAYLEAHSFELGNLNDPFCKIYHLNTTMEKYYSSDCYDKHMWIDIFPMDGLPNDGKKVQRIYRKSLFWRRLLQLRKVKEEVIVKEATSFFRAILKPLLKFFVDLLPARFYAKRIVQLSRKYSYRDSLYVGGIVWGYGPQERLLKSKVKQVVEVEFEGMKVKTFACFDEYLTNLYGDYMKMPPLEKRVAHVMKIKRKKEVYE